ncbi:TPA: DUF5710 domain-containing protein [Pseudomonas aeruginosa]
MPWEATALTLIYLDVPYAEKDSAKKLGARWDSSGSAAFS